jgi:hypothetical protein
MATNDDQGGCHDFTIFCNDKRFVVTACPGPAPDHPITLLLSRDSAATLAGDDDEVQKVQDEIEDMIYDAGWRMFAQLASSSKRGRLRSPSALHSSLYLETFYLRPSMVGRQAKIVQEYPSQPKYCPFHFAIADVLNLPRYLARYILVLQNVRASV